MTEPEHNEVSSPGGGVAGRVAKVVADASVYSRQRLSDHQVKLAVKAFTDATNHVSDEVRGVFGDMFKTAAEHPDMPDEFKPLLKELATGRGQAWAWIAGSALGMIMGGGLQDVMRNAWLPVTLPMIAKSPNEVLPPGVAAEGFAKGVMGNQESYDDSAKGGVRGWRQDILRELAQTRPDVSAILDLFRLGHYDQREAIVKLHRLGYDAEDAMSIMLLAVRHIELPDLGAMWNRDIISTAEGRQRAKDLGYSAADFDKMTELHGDPLPPMDLGEAFRRGFIDSKRFERGIVQGPLRKEWFDVLERLQFRRMSTIDAASAVTQGHMSLAEGKRVAHENGLEPDDFGTMIEIAGRPPGIDFATEALNRGLISEAEFTKMFLESSIKNRYVPLMLQMRTRLIPQETARLLYRNGVYSERQTLDLLIAQGFSPDDARALMELERVRGDDQTRELTRSQIVDMYETRMLDLNQTVELLLGLGYAENDARAMVELADLQRLMRFINSATTKVKSAYTTGKIDEITASSAMDALGIPVAQRDDLFTLWDIEKTTVTKTLTAAQVRQAMTRGLIDPDEAMNRLMAQGYDETDAGLYLQLSA